MMYLQNARDYQKTLSAQKLKHDMHLITIELRRQEEVLEPPSR